MKALRMKAALPIACLLGWILFTAMTARVWLSACCGFDAFNPNHYAYVWQAFLGGAAFHTVEHAAFLLTWPALLAWIWLTFVYLPVPVALRRLLEAGLAHTEDPESENTSAPAEATPVLPAGLGLPLPPPSPPPAAVVPAATVQPPPPASTAPAAAVRPAITPKRPAAPVPMPPAPRSIEEEYRPAGVAPVSREDLVAALAEYAGDAHCRALHARLLEEDDSSALTSAGVGLVATFAMDEHRRIGDTMGFRPALGLDDEGDAESPRDNIPDDVAAVLCHPNRLAWNAGSWSKGSVPGDSLLIALGGRSVYAIAVWSPSGVWADTGTSWTGADGQVLPSPVLAADTVASGLAERLEAQLPESYPYDVQALVLVRPKAAVEATQASDNAWQDLRVDVCSIDAGDLPSLVSLVGTHMEAPDQVLCSVLDELMERIG